MLKAMRKNLKTLKPFLWIVVGTFVLAIFAIWGGGEFGGSGRANNLATVGREKISSDEYYQSLAQRLSAMEKEFKGLSSNLIQQLNIPQQILEQIIQQRLLIQIGKEMGLRVSDEELRDRIVSYFQRDGQFIGYQEYRDILRYNRMPVKDFERSMAQDVLIQKVVRILTAGITVAEEEVWEAYRKENESAKIEYLVADKGQIEVADKPSDEEVQAYFEANSAKYRLPERRSADYIFIRGEDLKEEIVIQESEVEQYYNDNISQFTDPETTRVSRIFLPFTAEDHDAVMSQAEGILARARGGEDFAGLARTSSQDDKAAEGGDWGYFDWRSLDAPEIEAIENLEANQISEIVETEAGASVFKVTEKTPGITKTLEEVKTTIQGILEDQKTRDLVTQRIQSLEKLARREKSLDLAAQKQNLRISTSDLLKRGEGLGDIDTSGALSETLFTLEIKGISSPIYTYQGAGLAQLQSIEAERAASLPEVRDEVEEDIIDGWKDERAKNKLREFKSSGGDDWNSEASENELEYKAVETHKREQYLSLVGDKPEVDDLVFSRPLNEVSEPIAVESGYAIFRVLERTLVSREDFEKNRAAEMEKVLEQKKNIFLQSYIVKAREEKKVRINYDLFLRLNSEILARFTEEN